MAGDSSARPFPWHHRAFRPTPDRGEGGLAREAGEKGDADFSALPPMGSRAVFSFRIT